MSGFGLNPTQQQPFEVPISLHQDFAQYTLKVKAFSNSKAFIDGMIDLFNSGFTNFDKNKSAMIKHNSSIICLAVFANGY